ncbi:MAG: hypothetical protein H6R00_2251 [Proteobacteria bacterium]|nr:hypothetical protein [Pseudomonadota bacterium]
MQKLKTRFLWETTSPELFCQRMQFYTFISRAWKIRIEAQDGYLIATDTRSAKIHYAFPRRTPFYKSSISGRLKSLLKDYMLENMEIPPNATIIDCGANIGEVGMGLRLKSKTLNYHAFEPSEPEHRLCQLNNPLGTCTKAALWKKTEILTFYSKKKSADSSAIEMDGFDTIVTVDAITLDDYCRQKNIDDVFLLKLEAEGAEPEVLEGAKGILPKIHYITADCGFERGKERASTAPDVVNLLLRNGFEMVGMRPERTTILFRNVALTAN